MILFIISINYLICQEHEENVNIRKKEENTIFEINKHKKFIFIYVYL